VNFGKNFGTPLKVKFEKVPKIYFWKGKGSFQKKPKHCLIRQSHQTFSGKDKNKG